MEEFFRDSIWQFVGAIFGLIAIFISIAIFYAQRTRKRLNCDIISITPVVSTTDEVDGKIQILFEGKPVKKVHLLVIELSNIGNVPISTGDYEREISIIFGENTQILNKEILEANPENLKAEIESTNTSIILKPILLNSGDSITIKSLLSDFDNDIKIDGRIIGVKTVEKIARKDLFFARLKIFASIIVALAIPGIFVSNFGWAYKALYSILIIFVGLLGFIYWYSEYPRLLKYYQDVQ